MTKYIIRRLLLIIPTLWGMSVLIFSLMRLVPGDVIDVMMGAEGLLGPQEKEMLRRMYGLDRPFYVQYLDWLGRVLHGDLGTSLRTSQPVAQLLLDRLPVTLELALLSLTVAALVAIPLGTFSAVKRDSPVDLFAHVLALLGLSMPYFWLGSLLLLVTSLYFPFQTSVVWVSPTENLAVNLKMMVLPVLTLSVGMMAFIMRMTRSAVLEVLDQDYVRTARAKGLRESLVMTRHVMKNAAIPILTVLGLELGYLMGGTIVIEQVFGLPGIGQFLLLSISMRDYTDVQGVVLLIVSSFVFVNLAVDILYSYVDPRIRYS